MKLYIPLLLALSAKDKDNHDMSERPNYPELENIELPQPPMPWEPSKRWEQLMSYPDGAFWKIWNEHDDELTERFELSEYIDWLNEQYIMPGHVVSVVQAMLVEDSYDANFWRVRESESALMQRVEQDVLGLEPTETSDGLRWYESSAGFANGEYPTAVVAKLMGMEPGAFYEYLENNTSPAGWVVMKSGNYLIPVMPRRHSNGEKVIISGAQELTPDGNKLVNSILYAYEKGLNTKQ